MAGFWFQDMGEWIVTTKMAKTNRLKPAHEPFCIVQKPYEQSLDYNEQKWGVGRINIEGARIPWDRKPPKGWVAGGIFRRTFGGQGNTKGSGATYGTQDANPNGRYPSNVVGYLDEDHLKFFYAPGVSREEKGYYNDHPTTKPIALMGWLIKIYSQPGSTVLDPFMGSGSTGLAAIREGRNFLGIDLSPHYVDIARRRFEEELEVGRWSGELSVQTGSDSKDMAGSSVQAAK
jgi:site-specific DNA-methyltransferase (adenine-specific)